MGIIRGNWEASAKKGKLKPEAVEALVGRIRTATSYEDPGVANADVVVEAAFERMAVKKEIFAKLDQVRGALGMLLAYPLTVARKHAPRPYAFSRHAASANGGGAREA